MVIVRHRRIKTERIEKLLLVSVVPPHLRPSPPSITSAPVNHGSQPTSTDFCNKIGPSRLRRQTIGVAAAGVMPPRLR
jgi:hypothetical protein